MKEECKYLEFERKKDDPSWKQCLKCECKYDDELNDVIFCDHCIFKHDAFD